MEGFNDGEERLGKEKWARIIEGAEELLELDERSEDDKIFVVDETVGFGQNEVNGIAR